MPVASEGARPRGLAPRLAALAARRPGRVIGVWIVVLVAVGGAAARWGVAPDDTVRLPDAPAQQVLDLLAKELPDQAGGRATVVFHAMSGRIDDERHRSTISTAITDAARLPGVRSVIDPTGPAAPLLTSKDGRTAWAPVVFRLPATEVPRSATDALVRRMERVAGDDLQVGVGGQPIERPDVSSTHLAEAIGVVAAVVVLWVALGSLGSALVPLVVAGATVIVGLAGVRLLGVVTDVNLAAQAMCTMIGMAVGIDYSLLVLTRFRSARAAETADAHTPVTQAPAGESTADDIAAAPSPVAALTEALATSGRSVVFAGCTVMVSLGGLAVIGIPVVAVIGVVVSIGVVAAVVAAGTLLPALLVLGERRLDAGRWPLRRRHPDAERPTWSARWASAVCRRPLPALVAGLAVLGIAAVPVLSMHTAWPDARHRPVGDPARTAFDLMTDGFGVGANAPLAVAIPAGDGVDVEGARAWLARDRGVVSVSPALPGASGRWYVVQVQPQGGPEEASTAALVRRIRADSGAALGHALGVTGATAFAVDLDRALADGLVPFIAAVVAISLLVLTLVFRAPLVALKAALLNLAGIAAAYGAVVAVFQWGWLIRLVGLERPLPITSSLPVVMFAVLFGLSMDYEVFILSRVREEWLRTGDNRRSVVAGVASSSRVVTAAAVIMFAVFAAFTTATSAEVKMIGFGLAVAVLLDATLIRQVLVPASMTLLGRRNWWIPSWLDRVLPRLDVEG